MVELGWNVALCIVLNGFSGEKMFWAQKVPFGHFAKKCFFTQNIASPSGLQLLTSTGMSL